MVRAILNGCNGKMGQVISSLAKDDDAIDIVCGVDLNCTPLGEYPVYKSIFEFDGEADVVIDFSNPSCTDDLVKYCVEKRIPVVLCTTGLSSEQLEKVELASTKVAILRSANMSLGINLLLKLLKNAAKTLAPAGFDIEIVEKHHNTKMDAPSGTALALADSMREELDKPHLYTYVYDRSNVRKKRDELTIGISSVRGGTIVGEHDVLFAGTDEVLTFSHTAYSKAVFGKGAIEAAKFLAGKTAGLYNMSDVIGDI